MSYALEITDIDPLQYNLLFEPDVAELAAWGKLVLLCAAEWLLRAAG